MASKLLLAALLVVAAAMASANVLAPSATSAEVEKALRPTVHSLEDGKHKLVYNTPDGKNTCAICSPYEGGCGCGEIVAIRCELKRLKQKLTRLNKIAEPHLLPPHMQRAHVNQ